MRVVRAPVRGAAVERTGGGGRSHSRCTDCTWWLCRGWQFVGHARARERDVRQYVARQDRYRLPPAPRAGRRIHCNSFFLGDTADAY